MAKVVLIVRGPLGITEAPGVEVIQNPRVNTVSQKQDIPASLNIDDLLVKEPNSQRTITMKALREKIDSRGKD